MKRRMARLRAGMGRWLAWLFGIEFEGPSNVRFSITTSHTPPLRHELQSGDVLRISGDCSEGDRGPTWVGVGDSAIEVFVGCSACEACRWQDAPSGDGYYWIEGYDDPCFVWHDGDGWDCEDGRGLPRDMRGKRVARIRRPYQVEVNDG